MLSDYLVTDYTIRDLKSDQVVCRFAALRRSQAVRAVAIQVSGAPNRRRWPVAGTLQQRATHMHVRSARPFSGHPRGSSPSCREHVQPRRPLIRANHAAAVAIDLPLCLRGIFAVVEAPPMDQAWFLGAPSRAPRSRSRSLLDSSTAAGPPSGLRPPSWPNAIPDFYCRNRPIGRLAHTCFTSPR